MNITLHHNVKNNVTRTTFNYIRDNAGVTRADATVALENAGFHPGSVTSLIGQMLKNRLIRNENDGLYANQKEYTPLKQLTPAYTHTKKRVYAPEMLNKSLEWSADAVIRDLSVRQALAVYGELRKIFGG